MPSTHTTQLILSPLALNFKVVMTIVSVSPQNPADVVATIDETSPSALPGIVAQARIAQKQWWASGAAARSAALTTAANALAARADEAAALIVREVGKPAAEAAGEVGRAVAILRYYAQASFISKGDVFPPSAKGFLWSERRPHGVAGLITPWNFPLAIPLWKAAPALAAGNAAVLKPSPDAVGCASFLDEILQGALPAGLFSIVYGGAEVGEALVEAVDVVSFTGSNAVGRQIAVSATRRGIPVQAEMGGQNAAIVLPCADIASTAATIASASMWFAGQKCTCTRRVITVGHQPEFLSALVEAVRGLKTGDPAVAGNTVGPLINETSLMKFRSALESAKAISAEVLAGGDVIDGLFVQPTVVSGVPADHPLSCDEVFGPLITVHEATSLEHAIELAESVKYGLATSVHGTNHDDIMKVVDAVHTGMIKVNAGTTGVDFYAPFGGERESSIGQREQGLAALDFYSSTHTVTYSPSK